MSPVIQVQQYDTAEYILNLARALVNDTAQNLSGNLLSDSQPYTQVYLNAGYRDCQDVLMNAGYEVFPKEQIIYNIPPVASLDPAVQVSLGFNGYFDGFANHGGLYLPSDMVTPLVLWERQTTVPGVVGNQVFVKMGPCNDGLPSRAKMTWLREWDWHNDQIFMCGSVQNMDLRLRYNCYLPELVLGSSPPSQVMIRRVDRALAAFVAAEFAQARGSPQAQQFFELGNSKLQAILSQTARKKQRSNHRSQPYSGNSHCGWGRT
jgi:hypothetical protein